MGQSRHHLPFAVIFGLCASALLRTDTAAQPPVYEVHKIEALTIHPTDFNDSGWVLAFPGGNNDSAPIIIRADSQFVDFFDYDSLVGFGGWNVFYTGTLTNNGLVCGSMAKYPRVPSTDLSSEGFRADGAAFAELLPINSGDPDGIGFENCEAFAVNSGGTVVGRSTFRGPFGGQEDAWVQNRAARWTAGGPGAGFEIVAGYRESFAYAISEGGTAVGICQTPSGEIPGLPSSAQVFWQGSSPTELGEAPGGSGGRPYDINSSGWIVGNALFPVDQSNIYHAYLWRNGEYTDLHNPIHGATLRSVAVSINDSGQVIGSYQNAVNQAALGVFLRESGRTYLIDSLLTQRKYENDAGNFLESRQAIAINNRGDILAQSQFGFVYNLYRRVEAQNGIVVNSVGDDGDIDLGDAECWTGNLIAGGHHERTLRAAIEHANASAGPDTIYFGIPSSGMPTIAPLSPLPAITGKTIVDGTSQPGGRVEISGASIAGGRPRGGAAGDGLTVAADSCRLEGLVIDRFDGNGLVLQGGGAHEVYRMMIGTDPDSSDSIGNGGHGVLIASSSNNAIGDASFSRENLVARNGGAGIFVDGSSAGNTIRRNVIFGNGGLGIDLAPEGVALNDSADLDGGPNALANYPVIDSTTGPDSNPRVWGTVTGGPNAVWLVELFINEDCDTLGFGEGKRSAATTVVNMDGSTRAVFDTPLTAPLGDSQVLTATATDQDGNTSEFSHCWPAKQLEIIDGNDQPIPGREFLLYKVRNDPPALTETLVDTIATDGDGRALLRGDVAKGDSIKVSRLLHREPTKKTHGRFGSSHAIVLDNARFDSLSFRMIYDEVDDSPVQRIEMDHTTLVYNLFVSIEWDVNREYVDSLKQAFRNMANYMYDVSDGQVRFDTVAIADEKEDWKAADVQVLADNTYESEATRWGLFLGPPVPSAAMRIPRRWYGNADLGRNMSVTEQPLNPAAVRNSRMIAHEFGHLGMGFLDEYKFAGFSGRCRSLQSYYGFMESYYLQNETGLLQESATEMSWSRQYGTESCRNTLQYDHHRASCWDSFEDSEERSYDGVLAPILKPDERNLSSFADYFEGPNQNGIPVTYDVGALVEFVESIPAQVRRDRLAIARSFADLQPAPGVRVRQVIHGNPDRSIDQGYTADDARMVLLGVAEGDLLKVAGGGFFTDDKRGGAARADDGSWYSGEQTVTGSDGDVTIDLVPVAGSFPAVVRGDLAGGDGRLRLSGGAPPLSEPVPQMSTSGGDVYAGAFETAGTVLTAAFDNDPEEEGYFTVSAVDDSLEPFFFEADYSIGAFEDTTTLRQLSAKGGDCSFSWSDPPAERAMVTSTAYPTPRSGVDEGSRRAGRTHSLSVDSGEPSGNGYYVTIFYADSDVAGGEGIYGDEQSIRIFRWDDAGSGWEMVGGTVDTLFNAVTATAETTGVFAAFTTDADVVPPVPTIGVLQNPLLPSYLDIYVITDEPLAAPPELTANDSALAVGAVPGETSPTYKASYRLDGASSVTLRASATDAAHNVGEASEAFESFPAGRSASRWIAAGGALELAIPEGTFDRDRWLLLFRRSDGEGPVFDLEPHGLALRRGAELRIDPGGAAKSGTAELVIARRTPEGRWEPLPATVDERTGMLVASIDRLGVYRVRPGSSSDRPPSTALLQNRPNPFNGTTTITFTLADRRPVKLEVFGITGRRVAVLLDETREAGRHTVTWDGRDGGGRELGSGVYFYRLKSGDDVRTRRLVYLK